MDFCSEASVRALRAFRLAVIQGILKGDRRFYYGLKNRSLPASPVPHTEGGQFLYQESVAFCWSWECGRLVRTAENRVPGFSRSANSASHLD